MVSRVHGCGWCLQGKMLRMWRRRAYVEELPKEDRQGRREKGVRKDKLAAGIQAERADRRGSMEVDPWGGQKGIQKGKREVDRKGVLVEKVLPTVSREFVINVIK